MSAEGTRRRMKGTMGKHQGVRFRATASWGQERREGFRLQQSGNDSTHDQNNSYKSGGGRGGVTCVSKLLHDRCDAAGRAGDMAETLSAKERTVVHEKMQRLATKMGDVTQENVAKLTGNSTLRDALSSMGAKERGIKTAEVAWGWIATQQKRGKLLGVERVVQSGCNVVRPAWREVAMAKTGMDKVLRGAFTNQELDRVWKAAMVLAHARRAVGNRRGMASWEREGEEGQGEAVTMTKAALADMKQSTKSICNGSEEAVQLLHIWKYLGLVQGYMGSQQKTAAAEEWATEVAVKWRTKGVLRWPGLGGNGTQTEVAQLETGAADLDENSRGAGGSTPRGGKPRKKATGLLGGSRGGGGKLAKKLDEKSRVQQGGAKTQRVGVAEVLEVNVESGGRVSKQARGDWREEAEVQRSLRWAREERKLIWELGEGREPMVKRTRTGGFKVMVCLDLFAGTQSLGPVARSRGWVYIPFDLVELIWSPTAEGMVRNNVWNLGAGGIQTLWKEVQRIVRVQLGLHEEANIEVEVAYIWASMECTTFSPMDAMQTESCRVWKGKHRGEPDRTTDKGRAAAQADKCMQGVLKFISWAVKKFGAEWSIENPHGTLRQQRYMQTEEMGRLGLRFRLHRANWCVWRHLYCKLSDVWTSIQIWEPSGSTGTGRCGHDCGMGREVEGDFNHFWAIGQESFRLYRGLDKDEMKMMVPGGLHEEMISCRWPI